MMIVRTTDEEPVATSPVLPERVLEILRRKWACPLLIGLLAGPRRFSDFAQTLPRIKKGVLAGELLALVRDGLVRKEEVSGRPRMVSYSLTPVGQQFCALLEQLRDWEAHHLPGERTNEDAIGRPL